MGMEEVFPAHQRKRMVRMLRAAKADLQGRGVDFKGMSALQVFALRTAARSADRSRSLAGKMTRAGRTLS
jgi:hypothetical protein